MGRHVVSLRRNKRYYAGILSTLPDSLLRVSRGSSSSHVQETDMTTSRLLDENWHLHHTHAIRKPSACSDTRSNVPARLLSSWLKLHTSRAASAKSVHYEGSRWQVTLVAQRFRIGTNRPTSRKDHLFSLFTPRSGSSHLVFPRPFAFVCLSLSTG